MKTLIYSDVHGNLPAFEKMLEIERNCDSFICLGDLVNYGPWSNECVDLAMSLPNSILLMGNHEQYFINGYYPGAHELVIKFFDTTFKHFNRTAVIKTFIDSTLLDDFICKHTIYDSYIYPDTTVEINDNYLIGHSHHQFEYHYKNWRLINVGSVGQNRKNLNIINYVIFNASSRKFELKSIAYDARIVVQKMKDSDYPEECINYYMSKL